MLTYSANKQVMAFSRERTQANGKMDSGGKERDAWRILVESSSEAEENGEEKLSRAVL